MITEIKIGTKIKPIHSIYHMLVTNIFKYNDVEYVVAFWIDDKGNDKDEFGRMSTFVTTMIKFKELINSDGYVEI